VQARRSRARSEVVLVQHETGSVRSVEGSGIEGGPEAALEGETAGCTSCGGSRLSPVPRAVRSKARATTRSSRSRSRARSSASKPGRFSGDRARIARRAGRAREASPVSPGGRTLVPVARIAPRARSQAEKCSAFASRRSSARVSLARSTCSTSPRSACNSRDTERLLSNLHALVETGSTVLVVEHDADTIRAADYLIDLGPSGGRHGVASLPPGRRPRCSRTRRRPPRRRLPDRAFILRGPRPRQRRRVSSSSRVPARTT